MSGFYNGERMPDDTEYRQGQTMSDEAWELAKSEAIAQDAAILRAYTKWGGDYGAAIALQSAIIGADGCNLGIVQLLEAIQYLDAGGVDLVAQRQDATGQRAEKIRQIGRKI